MQAVTLARTAMRAMRSRAGHDYRISILQPQGEPGPEGFPVLYLLDGDAAFPIAAVCAAMQARRPRSTQVCPAVVVGIGYPVDDYLDSTRRTYDYTPPVAPDELPARLDGSAWPPHGGAAHFLDFIENELKPSVESGFAIDKSREAIFGHSFGGLFVLHALLTRPQSFRSYIAASPSIWFAKRVLLHALERFAHGEKGAAVSRDLLVTVGSLEGATAEPASSAGAAAADLWRRQNRMVENAADLSKRLAIAGGPTLNVAFKEFEDENHSSVLPAAISRAVRLAFGPKR